MGSEVRASRIEHLPVFLAVNEDFPLMRVCSSLEECRAYLASCTQYPVVIKPDFSNTGIGFVHIADQSRIEQSMVHIQRLFSEKGSKILIMPWLKRIKSGRAPGGSACSIDNTTWAVVIAC